MKIPIEWLNTYLDKPLSAREMIDALERAGVEVEDNAGSAVLDDSIVVGAVTQLEAHPDADTLQVAKVDVGGNTLQIVCGANNITPRQKVPVALVGAVLPDGTTITDATLRGVESKGMVCSQEELGLGAGEPRAILVLDPKAPVGVPVSTVIPKNDVIDATTAANRWDLNGMVWLAREAAAHSGRNVHPEIPEHISGSRPTDSASDLVVAIGSPKLVDRYMLAHLKVDNTRPTPAWLAGRLQAAGIRPISLVVDITNYVMLEYGQPLHAFDAVAVTLPMGVRTARAGETLTTLDGDRRQLDPADLLITDASGPIGLAGVMGGRTTEVSANTTAIYLESASFNGATLRQTAVRHGLRTDASARFERRLPVAVAPVALQRAVGLLQELAAAKLVSGPVDHLQTPAKPTKLSVRPSRLSALLGIKLTPPTIKTALAKLGFTAAADTAKDGLIIGVPWWRPDVTTEEDVAEEVIKLIGYDRLPATLPAWQPTDISFDDIWAPRWRAKDVLRSLGLFEIVTYSFISQDQSQALGRDSKQLLKLKNPLSSEQAYLRTDLLPSLLRVAERNRTYSRRFGLYEFSKVYRPQKKAGELPEEPLNLGILVRRPEDGYRGAKAALDRLGRVFTVAMEVRPGGAEEGVAHPARSGQVVVGDTPIGWIGQLHPAIVQPTKLGGEVGYLELEWSRFIAAARPPVYQPASRFPSVSRDLSVIVDRSVTWQQLAAALKGESAVFVRDYYGADMLPAKKAVTIRFHFAATDRTLTDQEADRRLKAVTDKLKQVFGAELRG